MARKKPTQRGGPGKLSAEKVQQLNICLTAQVHTHAHTHPSRHATDPNGATFWPQLIWWVARLAFCFCCCCFLPPFGRHKMEQGRQFKLKNYMHFRCSPAGPACLPCPAIHIVVIVVVFAAPLDEPSQRKINSNLFNAPRTTLSRPFFFFL